MIVRILYVVVLAMLVRLIWRGLFHPRVGEAPAIYKGLMVKDPVCGLHVPESRALVSVEAGETVHFCSEACRARYVESLQAHAR
jgi:YHS domain-containing protein